MSIICPICGNINEDGTQSCPACGAALMQQAPNPQQGYAQQTYMQQAPQQPQYAQQSYMQQGSGQLSQQPYAQQAPQQPYAQQGSGSLPQQPYVQQPGMQQGNNRMQQTPPSGEKKSILPIIAVISVILVLGITAIILFVKPGVLRKDKEEKAATASNTAEGRTEAVTEKPTAAATEATTEVTTEITTEAVTEVATEATTQATTEKPTEATTEAATEKPTEALYDPNRLSTSDRAEKADFQWFMDGYMHGGIHPKAESVTDLTTLTGGWKVLIFLDPYNIHGYTSYSLMNGTFLTDGKTATLTLHPDRMFEGEEEKLVDQSGNQEELYSGTWDKQSISMMGSYIRIDINAVYQAEGVQYVAGNVTYNSGETGYIAMVRPDGVGVPFEFAPDDEGY